MWSRSTLSKPMPTAISRSTSVSPARHDELLLAPANDWLSQRVRLVVFAADGCAHPVGPDLPSRDHQYSGYALASRISERSAERAPARGVSRGFVYRRRWRQQQS